MSHHIPADTFHISYHIPADISYLISYSRWHISYSVSHSRWHISYHIPADTSYFISYSRWHVSSHITFPLIHLISHITFPLTHLIPRITFPLTHLVLHSRWHVSYLISRCRWHISYHIPADTSHILSLTSALDGVGGQRQAPAALPPRMAQYPLYRGLGGPQGRSGQVRKISPPPRFDPRTVQPVASRYTDWAIDKELFTESCQASLSFVKIGSLTVTPSVHCQTGVTLGTEHRPVMTLRPATMG
jgi:hypothetical protein